MKTLIKCSTLSTVFSAFDNSKGWKVDDKGKLVTDDKGNPIYVDGAGKELIVNSGTIAQLNGEAMSHRTEKEALQVEVVKLTENLAKFDGIDPLASRDALEKIKALGDKELIDAGEVETVRAEIAKTYETQLAEKDATIDKLQNNTNKMTLNHAFATSSFVKDKIGMPQKSFIKTFSGNFKIEDGKLVPYHENGNKVFSKTNVGQPAEFDEALELLVDADPDRDSYYRSSGHSGTGNSGEGGSAGGGSVQKITRQDFDAMNPHKRNEVMATVQKGEAELVD